MQSISALEDVGSEPCCVCTRWSIRDEEDHSAVARKEQNNIKKQGVGERFEVERFREICGVVNVMRGNCGIFSMIKPIPPQFYHFYIGRLYRD